MQRKELSNIKLANKRQERFCIEYVKSLNATQSAINAGYSERTARQQGARLLTNANIQNRIKELAKPGENKRIASAEDVLEFLTGVFTGRIKNTGINLEGEEVEVETPMKERIRAAELIGRRHSLFTDKLEHSGQIKGDNKLDAILEQLKDGHEGDT